MSELLVNCRGKFFSKNLEAYILKQLQNEKKTQHCKEIVENSSRGKNYSIFLKDIGNEINNIIFLPLKHTLPETLLEKILGKC